MQGCIAPSEIPGISSTEASVFGAVAEELIYADFLKTYVRRGTEVFQDHHNPAAYLLFLATNNPHFTEQMQRDYFERAWAQKLAKVPDFLVHKPTEKAFYEVKPDSTNGMKAGVDKVGKLSAVYRYYRLPYHAGNVFTPRDHNVASYGTALRVVLRVRRVAPGLIVYKLCLESEGTLELATLAVLLAYIVREINKQKGTGGFRPVDLAPAFQSNRQLVDVAKALGITLAVAAAATVGWKYFWKAVAKRFAARGAAAALMSAADGPLPVGELLSAGLAIWTVIDIIRLSDELWRDAAIIARQEA
ncbi:hypothetical protein [Fuerstiella marisgermanici]|uniref:Uncharacterized protein n=1 Tax=Fuerstiella marisgermanici TaxID=1891926 RepID=A0A1P8WKP0_9PLAN|nr:hypothetical protein [Fuerstiella marisgermanici]APZ94607.1 hypothetical protein Fuma_04239 [Fuerstiella marisgermanici]